MANYYLYLGLQISGNNVKELPSPAVDENGEKSVSSKYTIDQILDKATEYMDTYNYEMAQKFCQRALEIDNDNVRALETTATLLLEVIFCPFNKHLRNKMFSRFLEEIYQSQ